MSSLAFQKQNYLLQCYQTKRHLDFYSSFRVAKVIVCELLNEIKQVGQITLKKQQQLTQVLYANTFGKWSLFVSIFCQPLILKQSFQVIFALLYCNRMLF